MNTILELQLINLLKRSNLDRLEFHSNDKNKTVGYTFYYKNEFPCGLDFEQDGQKLILIDKFSIGLYDFPLYFYLKRGTYDRNDIQNAQLNVLGEAGQKSEIRYIVDIDDLNESNVESYLYNIEGWKYTHPKYVDLRYSNYQNYDLSELVMFKEDGARIIALDRFGVAYKCHDPEVTKKLLASHFAMAYTENLIRNTRRMTRWIDGWRSYKQSNGHCLYIKEEYLMNIPKEIQNMELEEHKDFTNLINTILSQLF